MLNFLTRPKHRPWAQGGSDFARWMDQQPDAAADESMPFDQEHRRALFHWAAREVQRQVKDATWQAFYRSSVLQEPVTRVAAVARDVRGGRLHRSQSSHGAVCSSSFKNGSLERNGTADENSKTLWRSRPAGAAVRRRNK